MVSVQFANTKFTSKSYKFRTAPPLSSSQSVKFVAGGDLRYSTAGVALCKHAATLEPLFAIVAGDVFYDNGNCFVYVTNGV